MTSSGSPSSPVKVYFDQRPERLLVGPLHAWKLGDELEAKGERFRVWAVEEDGVADARPLDSKVWRKKRDPDA